MTQSTISARARDHSAAIKRDEEDFRSAVSRSKVLTDYLAVTITHAMTVGALVILLSHMRVNGLNFISVCISIFIVSFWLNLIGPVTKANEAFVDACFRKAFRLFRLPHVDDVPSSVGQVFLTSAKHGIGMVMTLGGFFVGSMLALKALEQIKF
jgi:hypothetical protein